MEKYIVRLSGEEGQKLETLVKKLKGTSQQVKRAIVLLHADANGPDWTNEQIAQRTGLVMHDFKDAQKVTIVLDHFSLVFWGSHEGIV